MSFDSIKAAHRLVVDSALPTAITTTTQQQPIASVTSHSKIYKTKMHFNMNVTKMIVSALILTVIIAALVSETEATYRKPPFNGSIFGKRGSTAEYDSASKALSAMCEIANEACQSWFPSQDNK